MFYVLFAVLLAVSYFVGVFGFCQIIGSLQTKQKSFLFTIVFWVAVLVGVYFAAKFIFPNQIFALYIGYGISFLQSLFAGKIE